MKYFEKKLSDILINENCRYFTRPDNDTCICIEIYGSSKELGISDGQWDIYNSIYEQFNIINWSFIQEKNQECCLTLIVKKPKRFMKLCNPYGHMLWIDNKDGQEYRGFHGLETLLEKLNEEI